MVTASAGVQTDLSQVVHSSCRSFATHLNHKVSLYVSPVPDQNAWDMHALNINGLGLTAYAYRSMALLHRVIENQAIQLPNHCTSPRLARDALVFGTECSNRLPLQLPVSRILFKQSHNYVFHSNPLHLNLHAWCLGVDSSKTSLRCGRIAVPQINKDHLQVKWALFEKWCRENSVDFSMPSVKQVSDFFMYLYQDLNRRPSTIDGYRTDINDTLGPMGLHISQSSDLNRLLSSLTGIIPKVPEKHPLSL